MILGCIADDFTGASDAASFLVKGGMRTLLFNGIPEDDITGTDTDAVVIALKTRTQERDSAVVDSLDAIDWLEKQGAKHFYVKYCSTFDSTPKGNIGPICDAVMERLQVENTLLCPSLPVNGRTVKDAVLYVHGVKLEESHMRNHPLTPMRGSNLIRLMGPQSRYESRHLSWKDIELAAHSQLKGRGYFIPDYETDEDGEKIISSFGAMKLLTGGSGILTAWAEYLLQHKRYDRKALRGSEGRGVLLAGSCSKATLQQIAWFQERGGLSYKLYPDKILKKEQGLDDIRQFLRAHKDQDVLIYSSETPQYLEEIRGETLLTYSLLIENMLAAAAVIAKEEGVRHIIVAGGETSGAVTKALGYQAYWIGQSIAPGVPVMAPLENPEMRIVLKSGNFGQEEFFGRALTMTGEI